MTFHIALVGNPNTGKTTLFNKLAGTRQKVGNWAGVTVDCKTGFFNSVDTVNGTNTRVDMTDLPGIYSLDNQTGGMDEVIARRFLTQDDYDVIVNVVDATNLKRNLKLTQELVALGRPIVIVLTMTDLARKLNIMPDIDVLSKNIGVPIVDGHPLSVADLQGQLLGHVQALPSVLDTILQGDKSIKHPVPSLSTWLNNVVTGRAQANNFTDKIDRIVLHPWLGIPIFLLAMYAMFAVAIGVGTLFIDPIDQFAGYWFVVFPSHWMAQLGAPEWLIVIFANGLGGGVQLVASFIPVIGFLYLCLSVLEDSGYMARAAFIVDRIMSSIGLPGQAFIPLLLGFGCNVPSIMATRSLTNVRQRMLTMAMAPFMSCGARLAVYVMFVSVFFRENGGVLVFGLYLLGIVMAVGTAWIFRKQLFRHARVSVLMEMPHYHRPRWSNVGLSSWHKVRGFIVRAGKTIILVSAVLTILNAVPSWQSTEEGGKPSALAEIGQVITPMFAPIGMGDDNWPAAVGVFTGILAKEAVVGTMDTLYSGITRDGSNTMTSSDIEYESPISNLIGSLSLLGSNLAGVVTTLTDPLGLTSVSDAKSQVIAPGNSNMVALFEGWKGAFSYLVFVLLYTPCAATIGALMKEGGLLWTSVIVAWSTSVAYVTAVFSFQLLTFTDHPFSASVTMGLAALWLIFFIIGLKVWVKPRIESNIIAVG
ncbi:ferrous iron transport protein B [Marinomonas sp. IMCC 4694]|uniref:ferrous iron transport protein B n=1 Tax=Marinomonas sp. IMCC 4694 TaxID=2605432 RepID=UPI0011E7EE07|nr:ferrous iron transport protein B [Marinomonas sp. IMCC 4694]TYL48890.1 ferrous iron transport protein B [Marinomonas sp. IMCC 4694]